ALLAKSDYSKIAELDLRLKDIKTSDLWSPYAAQLRAEWRLSANDPSGRLGLEALNILDSVLATQPTIDVYILRACAGLKLQNHDVFTESVGEIVTVVNRRLRALEAQHLMMGAEEHSYLSERLSAFSSELSRRATADATGRAALILSRLVLIQELMQI
ncbi:MAG: hypothetical protein RLN69_15680, partial [Woeseiaceae bacterium]